jgi:osmotically-inducible protein OsmY
MSATVGWSQDEAQFVEGTGVYKPNYLVERDVKEALDWDPVLGDSRITVTANDGLVTLRGIVLTCYDSELATDDTFSVTGVTRVDNQLLVSLVGEAIADGHIADDCMAALDNDRLIPNGATSVVVTNGWVTLSGEFPRHFQRQAAVHAVRRVAGVLGITDNIVLSSEPIPSDVADRINRAFKRNAVIDDSLINISDVDHTIFLDGSVGSWYAMNEAVNTAWKAQGARRVLNRLVIIP